MTLASQTLYPTASQGQLRPLLNLVNSLLVSCCL